MKLFVGRLAKDTTKDEVNDYFSEFGDMTDVFVPWNPFRGFAFITFADQEDAERVLSKSHYLKVNIVKIAVGVPDFSGGFSY